MKTDPLRPRPGELPLKQWRYEEAARCGVGPAAIFKRMAAGKYPHLKIRKVNSYVIFVTP